MYDKRSDFAPGYRRTPHPTQRLSETDCNNKLAALFGGSGAEVSTVNEPPGIDPLFAGDNRIHHLANNGVLHIYGNAQGRPAYYDKPEEFARDIFLSHFPVINVSCSSSVRAGHPLIFVADLAGEARISFLWRVSAGKITDGQGTRSINVDTTGLEGKSIVATVKLGRVEASCATQVAAQ